MRTNTTLSTLMLQAFWALNNSGEEVEQKTWQNIKSPGNTIELEDYFRTAIIPETPYDLVKEVKPSLPWAEDHFQERVGGIPLNPGNEYKNWPLYKPSDDDARFRAEGKFSHSYMERFWPKVMESFDGMGSEIRRGIRYEYGDYDDIIERAKEDNTSRQLYLSIWHPEDQSNGNGRVPCTLGYRFSIRKGKVSMTYFIRSCDILRHFKNDIYMAVRLAQDFRDKVNPELQMGTFSIWVGSLHCFTNEKFMLPKQASKI